MNDKVYRPGDRLLMRSSDFVTLIERKDQQQYAPFERESESSAMAAFSTVDLSGIQDDSARENILRTNGGLAIKVDRNGTDGVGIIVGVWPGESESYKPPAEYLVLHKDQGPVRYQLNNKQTNIDLKNGDHLLLPLDRDAQQGLQKLHQGLDYLPPDHRTMVLNSIRDPGSALEKEIQEATKGAAAVGASNAPTQPTRLKRILRSGWALAALVCAGIMVAGVVGYLARPVVEEIITKWRFGDLKEKARKAASAADQAAHDARKAAQNAKTAVENAKAILGNAAREQVAPAEKAAADTKRFADEAEKEARKADTAAETAKEREKNFDIEGVKSALHEAEQANTNATDLKNKAEVAADDTKDKVKAAEVGADRGKGNAELDPVVQFNNETNRIANDAEKIAKKVIEGTKNQLGADKALEKAKQAITHANNALLAVQQAGNRQARQAARQLAVSADAAAKEANRLAKQAAKTVSTPEDDKKILPDPKKAVKAVEDASKLARQTAEEALSAAQLTKGNARKAKLGAAEGKAAEGKANDAIKAAKKAQQLAGDAIKGAEKNNGKDVAKAQEKAKAAQEKANEAKQLANEAKQMVDNSNKVATSSPTPKLTPPLGRNEFQGVKDAAVQAANKAKEFADRAVTTATQARVIANEAIGTASAAKPKANELGTDPTARANKASQDAASAKTVADEALEAAKGAQSEADAVVQTANRVADLDGANAAKTKAELAKTHAEAAIRVADSAKGVADAAKKQADAVKAAVGN